jgi:hypothetical protein
MTSNPRRARRGGWVVLAVVIVVVLPLGYVASIGPATALAYRDRLSWDTCNSLYGPLNGACGAYHPLRRALQSYNDWWRQHLPGEPEPAP